MKKYLLLAIILSYSCERSQTNNLIVVDLFATPKSEVVKLSEIGTDIDYIPLQTNDSALISNIWSFKATEKNFYLSSQDAIYCFGISGRFKYKLSKSGRGPTEYLFLANFDINFDESLIAILSFKSIMLYNLSGDSISFFRKLSFPYPPSKINFSSNENNILLQYSNEDGKKPFSKILINLKGDTLQTVPNYMKFTLKDGWISYSLYENVSYWFDKDLYLKELQNDTLFRLTRRKILDPYILFDTKDKRLTPLARSNGKYFSNHDYEYALVKNIMETDRFLYYSFSYNKIENENILDKKLKSFKRINGKKKIVDDLAGGPNFSFKYCLGNNVYSWIDSFTLKEFVLSDIFKNESVKLSSNKRNLHLIAENLKETDNPVIIILKTKY